MTTDIDKDDKATREMLEMMGALPDDIETEAVAENTDDLLDALDEIENTNSEDDFSSEVDEELNDLLDDLENIEIPDALETAKDTSRQGQELESALSATTDDIADKTAEPEEFNLDDFDMGDLDDTETIDDSEDLASIAEETASTEQATENSIEQDDLDMLDEFASLDEIEPTNEAEKETTKSTDTNIDPSNDLLQANQLIDTMQESIGIDNDIQNIADKCSQITKQAAALAIEISEQAQSSTEKYQQNIQATFDATKRAFEVLKEAKYEVDTDALNIDISTVDITDKMAKIREKNQQLKDINASLSTRINELSKR